MRVIVTTKAIELIPKFPASAFSEIFDLDHTIPIEAITQIKNGAGILSHTIILEWTSKEAPLNRVEMRLWNPTDFLTVLDKLTAKRPG